MKTKAFLKKPCERCGTSFLPSSHHNKLCENCHKKANLILHLKRIKDSIDNAINKLEKL